MVSAYATRLAARSPAIAAAHFRAEAAPYHPEHRRDGYLNLGTAENRLVWDLLEPRVAARPPLSAADVRYAALHGTPTLRAAVAEFLSGVCRSPVDADELVIVSGATAALDIVATALCDPGDVIVAPAPYYGAFDIDLAGRSGARLVPAPTGSDQRFELVPAVVEEALDGAAAVADGNQVRAVALASPGNPVGRVHPAAVLGELVEVAQRRGVDLVTDEIYANSVFGSTAFTSLLDPAVNPTYRQRTHLVWGFAKDFGVPGLKVGVLYSPDPEVRAAARALAYFAPVSTDTQALLSHLLADREWLDGFAAESRRRLGQSYARCSGQLDELGIPYLPAQAGFSVWVDLRNWLPEPSFAGEQVLWATIFDTARVNILPGGMFASPEPGWFRVCHPVDRATVTEALGRLGRLLHQSDRQRRRQPERGAAGRPAGGQASRVAEARPAGRRAGAGGSRPLTGWYQSAGVRSGPRRMFDEEHDHGKRFFPDQLVPYLSHPAVGRLPPERRRELVVRHLYQFLLSTTHMETRVVNRGAERIANGRAGLDLPPAVRMDAFKVYCDEGYHSLYSLDLADQIAAATGVALPSWDYGGFLDRLEESGRRCLPAQPVLAQLLQVVVFETLITAVLNEVPPDGSVVTAVRDITRDHARDEGRHHRFFSGLFHDLWSQLDPSLRTRVAQAIPPMIEDCLRWDVEPVRLSLVLAGLDEDAARAVLEDCYGGAAGADRIAETAQATVRMCASAGVLDVPGGMEAFAAFGLVGDDGELPASQPAADR